MSEPSEREQGYADGVLQQRLAQYDIHFAAINGSQERTFDELVLIRRSLDALAAAQLNAEVLAAAVAEALTKKENEGITNRGVVAWAAGLILAAFAVAAGIKAWLGVP